MIGRPPNACIAAVLTLTLTVSVVNSESDLLQALLSWPQRAESDAKSTTTLFQVAESDLKRRDDKVWLFGMDGHRKPENYIDKTGTLVGFNIDLINKVCREAKKRCEAVFVEYSEIMILDRGISFAGRGIMSGAFDAFPGFVSSPERRAAFDFTLPYMTRPASFSVRPGNPSGFDPEKKDLSQFSIAYQEGSFATEACLARLGLRFGRVVMVTSGRDAEEMVRNGTVDVLFSAKYYIRGLTVLPDRPHCDDGGTSMAVKKGSHLPQWWDCAFKQLKKSGRFEKFCTESIKKYNHEFNCHLNETTQVAEGTQSKINSFPLEDKSMHKVWLFGFSGRRKPFAYLNEYGHASGFNIDFVHAVCAEAGQRCEFVLTPFTDCSYTSDNSNYAGQGLAQGWISACAGYADAPDRANAVDFTAAFLPSGAHFAVPIGNPKGFDPMATDFSNFTITHLTGAYTNPSCLTRLGKKFGRILVADNLPQAKSFLADGKADVIFAPRREIPGLKVFDHPFHCEKSGSAVMTRKGSPLIGWWNKAFEAFVKSGGYQKLCEEGRAKYNFNIRCLADKEILSYL